MRIVVLHTRLAPYYAACLRELGNQGGELLIYARPRDKDAPFDPGQFGGLGEVRDRSSLSVDEIGGQVMEFHPDAVLVAGWADRGYMKICRKLRKKGIPVIAGCDTQWKGSLRQHVASWTARWHIQKSIDVLWVSGERQRVFAKALGYEGDRCWDGVYACDWKQFSEKFVRSGGAELGDRKQESPFFLFVGRYVDVKGIDTLAEAYRRYCEAADRPWRLVCAGAGPLRQALIDAGAEDQGFVQPSDLPDLMAEASAFVLPSRFEPWGVVVQEAAASGLPLICSEACGAGVHLLRDRYNGYTFQQGNVTALKERMVRMSSLADDEYNSYVRRSYELSRQYSPERWVRIFSEGVKMLKS